MEQSNKVAIEILNQLYQNRYTTDEYDYDTVDVFYAYLGYELNLYDELPKLNINSTSELQEALMQTQGILLSSLPDEQLRIMLRGDKEMWLNVLGMIQFRNDNSDPEDQHSMDDEAIENYFIEEVHNGVYSDTYL